MGIFIFGMVFLYFLAFGIFRFIKNGNVSSYVVNSGSLSDNTTFTAFAIRSESVFKADKSGEIQMYAREGSKVGFGETVYTLDESGYLKSVLQNLSSEQSNLSESDFKYLQGLMSNFKQSYVPSNFSKVYDFKMSMESDILDSLNLSALNNNSIDTSKFEINKATEPGIIVYSYDGYEDVTVDSFTKDMVNNHKQKKNSTRGLKEVNSGDTVYKLITDENWHLVMAIDDNFESKIKDKKSIQIRFIDDSHGTLIAVASKFGVIKLVSEWIGTNLGGGAVTVAMTAVGAGLSFVSDGMGVCMPTFYPMMAGIAATAGVSIAPMFLGFTVGIWGTAASPLSSAGGLGMSMCDEENRGKLFTTSLITTICYGVWIMLLALVGVFNIFG